MASPLNGIDTECSKINLTEHYCFVILMIEIFPPLVKGGQGGFGDHGMQKSP